MISSRRILEVSKDRVLLIEERFAGYRAEVILTLNGVIRTQQEGLSDRGRRDRVLKIVDALAGKVSAKQGST